MLKVSESIIHKSIKHVLENKLEVIQPCYYTHIIYCYKQYFRIFTI